MKRDYDVPELCLDWVIPGQVAALACPGPDQLPLLARLGFHVLVSLNEDPPETAAVLREGLEHVRIPFADYTAPTQQQIGEFVAALAERLRRGQTVAVHCQAGVGRTGTMLACYFVSLGMSPTEAIEHMRRRRPGAVESDEQERAIRDYWVRMQGGRHRPGDPAQA